MFTSTLASARGRLRQWARDGRQQRRVLGAIPALVLRDIGLGQADLVRDCDARSLGW